MAILSVQRKKKETRLVGAHLPLQAYGYISLYSLAKGLTKNKIFMDLIDNWATEQKAKEPDHNLFMEIAERINIRWDADKKVNPSASFTKFKEVVSQELKNKGIDTTYITAILEEIKK